MTRGVDRAEDVHRAGIPDEQLRAGGLLTLGEQGRRPPRRVRGSWTKGGRGAMLSTLKKSMRMLGGLGWPRWRAWSAAHRSASGMKACPARDPPSPRAWATARAIAAFTALASAHA